MRLGRACRAWSPAAGTCTAGACVREDGSCCEYPSWEGGGVEDCALPVVDGEPGTSGVWTLLGLEQQCWLPAAHRPAIH